jgi:putative NADH-flavin reductase
MRITVFGASGAVGSRVTEEALSRGHDVTAVGRSLDRLNALLLGRRVDRPTALAGQPRIRRGDAADPQDVAELSAGQDVVISATRPLPGQEAELAIATKGLLAGLAGGTRLIVVGGAASLLLPTGTTVLDGPDFPPDWRPIAEACNEQLAVLRAETEIDWAYVSPPAILEPGTRTGSYRLGKDHLLLDADGNSAISMEDFAIALVDEAEHPRHHRTRFTVGYQSSIS